MSGLFQSVLVNMASSLLEKSFFLEDDCSVLLQDAATEELMTVEMSDAEIFPPKVDAEMLLGQMVGHVESKKEQNYSPVIKAAKKDPEMENTMPFSRAALNVLHTLQGYVLVHGDEDVLGDTFNIAWYENILQERFFHGAKNKRKIQIVLQNSYLHRLFNKKIFSCYFVHISSSYCPVFRVCTVAT